MNITFLIGNGFDRNLGLDTAYSDFVQHYKRIIPHTEVLRKFRDYIKDNQELWVDAEVAMGEYTGELGKGGASEFSECHTHFCIQLSKYLKQQMTRIDYEEATDQILTAFSEINRIAEPFPSQERDAINSVYRSRAAETITFNFVCYNYTDTLDQCLSIVDNSPTTLGNHKYSNSTRAHILGQIRHVHGTVDKDMVFGVNDDSQIVKLDVFECENGDLYKNTLVKQQTNASYQENVDNIVWQLIKSSHIIYVYGMSIGETDAVWWERICTWLSDNKEHHLIIHKFDMPQRAVVPIGYQLEERNAKRKITKFSHLDNQVKSVIESQIHITGENIFLGIKNIAKPIDYAKIRAALPWDREESENKELATV